MVTISNGLRREGRKPGAGRHGIRDETLEVRAFAEMGGGLRGACGIQEIPVNVDDPRLRQHRGEKLEKPSLDARELPTPQRTSMLQRLSPAVDQGTRRYLDELLLITCRAGRELRDELRGIAGQNGIQHGIVAGGLML
jgi:hypothetical protein